MTDSIADVTRRQSEEAPAVFRSKGRLLLVATALVAAGCATHSAGPAVVDSASAQPKTVIGPDGGAKPTIDLDGTYLVGISITDIQMGTYRNAGGTDCYWARLRSLDPNDVIESDQSTRPQEVVIRASDTAFLTRNCGTWQMTSL